MPKIPPQSESNEWKTLGGKIHKILNESIARPLSLSEYAKLCSLISDVFKKAQLSWTPPQMSEKMELTNGGKPHVCRVPAIHDTKLTDRVFLCTKCHMPVDQPSPTESVKETGNPFTMTENMLNQAWLRQNPEPVSEWEKLRNDSVNKLISNGWNEQSANEAIIDLLPIIQTLLTRQHLSILREQSERMGGMEKECNACENDDEENCFCDDTETFVYGHNSALSTLISHNEAEIKRLTK